jgi:hypothetical protein
MSDTQIVQFVNNGARRRTLSKAALAEIASAKADVQKLARRSRLAVEIVAWVLATACAFIIISEKQVLGAIVGVDPGLLYKGGLFLLYTSWVFGAKFDVDIEEKAYARDDLQGALDWRALSVIALLTLTMTGFFWLHGMERFFGFGLLALVAVNILTWKTVCLRIKGPIDHSMKTFTEQGDYFAAEKLKVVANHIRGAWQKTRFRFMLASALVLIVAANAIHALDLATLAGALQLAGLSAAKLVALMPAMLFLAYVAVTESWIWIRRQRAAVSIETIERLSRGYQMRPRASAAARPERPKKAA